MKSIKSRQDRIDRFSRTKCAGIVPTLGSGIPHQNRVISKVFLLFILIAFPILNNSALAQVKRAALQYIVSVPQPGNHIYHVELQASGWELDTLNFKMPQWMPGYYQLMNYSRAIENISAHDENGRSILLTKTNSNSWKINGIRNKSFILKYDVRTERQFVANSYVDSAHAYIVPANTFLYVDGFLNTPVSVKVTSHHWNKIATGLEMVKGKPDEFAAAEFDVLYDCPILIGNLEELPSFNVNGIEHRFIGYNIGSFDQALFINNLKKIVEAAVAVIGDIPYKQYTFIGIGPGRGGIEHLNNTTFSFNGNELNSAKALNKMMNFLAHEYFHHYNVKRIRPFELGPFDYDQGNRTNLLWVSEGLSVYYEYLIVKRAGLINEQTLFANFEENMNAVENNPGRFYQSLAQASYNTWKDGPFGTQGEEKGKSISYYDKGPLVGLLLDFSIRHATQNKNSLDDVMRFLYWQYYKKQKRGFTDAEFEQTCESVAGISLTKLFEFVYTTKELDYNTYMGYAGLKMELLASSTGGKKEPKKFKINRSEKLDSLQSLILKSWLGE